MPRSNDTYYDSISPSYDELYAAEQLDKLARIMFELHKRGLTIDPSWSLLDVGCGTGVSTAFFNCAHKVGVDPSEQLIDIANRKFKDKPLMRFMIISAEELEGHKQFDLIVSITAIQNFDDVELGLNNMLAHGKQHIYTILKSSPKVGQVRLLLKGFEEIDLGKDIMFIKF